MGLPHISQKLSFTRAKSAKRLMYEPLPNSLKFLSQGTRLRFPVVLRGREIQHSDQALALLTRFFADVKDLAIMDTEPRLEGKSVIMILSPNPQRPCPAGASPQDPAPEE